MNALKFLLTISINQNYQPAWLISKNINNAPNQLNELSNIFTQNIKQSRFNFVQFQLYLQELSQQQLQMQADYPKYTYLVTGQSGGGKSALCKNLTGDPNIKIANQAKSCTLSCTIYKSTAELNQDRGYQIEVIDTPGINAKDINTNESIANMLKILNEVKTINAVLYVISYGSPRDTQIGQFLKLLIYLFSIQKLNTSIIPILTKFDKQMNSDELEIKEFKQSRQKQLKKLFYQLQQSQITFWNNHIDWINKVNQKWKDSMKQEMEQYCKNNLSDLILKTKNTKLQIIQSLDNFQKKLRQLIVQRHLSLNQQNKKIETQQVKIPNFQIPLRFKSNSEIFLQSLFETSQIFKQPKFILSGNLIDLTSILVYSIIVGLKFYINSKQNQQSTAKQKKLCQSSSKQILDRIYQYLFLQQLSKKRIQIKRHTNFLQGYLKWLLNSCADDQLHRIQENILITLKILPMHYIQGDKYKQSITQLNSIQIKNKGGERCKRLSNDEYEDFQKNGLIQIPNQIQGICFIDNIRNLQLDKCYEFQNMTIKRPSDKYFNELFQKIIENPEF